MPLTLVFNQTVDGINNLPRRNFLGTFKSPVGIPVMRASFKRRPRNINIVVTAKADEAIDDAIGRGEFKIGSGDTAD